MHRLTLITLCLLCAVRVFAAGERLAARTVVLVNTREPESVRLGEYYADLRGIPHENLVALPMPVQETITWRQFIDEVWQPLQDELFRRGWLEGVSGQSLDRLGRRKVSITDHRIAYLVVCRGTPLRIEQDPLLANEKFAPRIPAPFRTNCAAVDSELSLLAQGSYEIDGYVQNPYFARDRTVASGADLVIKISRLDGPNYVDARHLVTSALAAEEHGLLGRYYVDLRGENNGAYAEGDRWLKAALAQLEELGFDGDLNADGSLFAVSARFDAPVFYFGWYTTDVQGPFLREGFAFPPGAVALHIHSYSAQTLRSDKKAWCGPFLARGVAATVGNVFEPYLQLTHRPDLLLRALARGDTWGDAVYYALPALSWEGVAVGDPLYRPFKVSMDMQRKQLARLPLALAPYAVLREARLLDRNGLAEQATAVLQAGMRQFPNLALSLAQARRAVAAKDQAGVAKALGYLPALAPYRLEDWPLARAAAGLLEQAGAHAPALDLYRGLAHSKAPATSAQLELLDEARRAATAAGSIAASLEFERLRTEAVAKAAVPPPSPGPSH